MISINQNCEKQTKHAAPTATMVAYTIYTIGHTLFSFKLLIWFIWKGRKRHKKTEGNQKKSGRVKKTVEKDQKKKLKRPERTENKIIRSTVYLLNV